MYVCIPVSLLCMEKLLHKPVVEIILEPFDSGGTGVVRKSVWDTNEILSHIRASFIINALRPSDGSTPIVFPPPLAKMKLLCPSYIDRSAQRRSLWRIKGIGPATTLHVFEARSPSVR